MRPRGCSPRRPSGWRPRTPPSSSRSTVGGQAARSSSPGGVGVQRPSLAGPGRAPGLGERDELAPVVAVGPLDGLAWPRAAPGRAGHRGAAPRSRGRGPGARPSRLRPALVSSWIRRSRARSSVAEPPRAAGGPDRLEQPLALVDAQGLGVHAGQLGRDGDDVDGPAVVVAAVRGLAAAAHLSSISSHLLEVLAWRRRGHLGQGLHRGPLLVTQRPSARPRRPSPAGRPASHRSSRRGSRARAPAARFPARCPGRRGPSPARRASAP